MIELKKSELESTLLSISTYDVKTQELLRGLLKEDLTLGTKRKLQKIHKKVHVEYEEFIKDFKKLEIECKGDKEKFEKEVQELLNEVVKLDCEPISILLIENISTTTNYNFDIIEKIAI